MNEKAEAPEVKNARPYDVAPPAQYAEFMRTGWAPSDLEGLQPLEVVTYASLVAKYCQRLFQIFVW